LRHLWIGISDPGCGGRGKRHPSPQAFSDCIWDWPLNAARPGSCCSAPRATREFVAERSGAGRVMSTMETFCWAIQHWAGACRVGPSTQ
jgi:hypothetical protein